MKNKLALLSICFLALISCVQTGIKDKITAENADQITTFDETDIESMVTYYFASRVRGDKDWKKVVPDPKMWSDRMKHCIEAHNKWKFVEFQNLGLYQGKYGSYVKVRIKIEVDGKIDGGEDDVEFEKVNGKCIITCVPT